jgi:predicted PurR-regulated permease PerM
LASSLGFLVYGMAEAITLTIDTSLMSLVPSLIIAIAPTFYQKDSAYQSDVSI